MGHLPVIQTIEKFERMRQISDSVIIIGIKQVKWITVGGWVTVINCDMSQYPYVHFRHFDSAVTKKHRS